MSDNILDELRYLWNTRETRLNHVEVKVTPLEKEDRKYSLVFYNVYKVSPGHFSSKLKEEEECEFYYGLPRLDFVHEYGSRKSYIKEHIDEEFIRKVGRPRKENKPIKEPKGRGRPKEAKNKTNLMKLISEKDPNQMTYKQIQKMLNKPFKLKKFKKDYKFKKVEWKKISKMLEELLKHRI